jgi:hypothetical protein
MLPRSVEEAERKGIAKLCRVPTAGCHKQNDLNCTGCKPSIAGRATTESMVRQRIMRQKPLYLLDDLPKAGWSGEDCGLNRLDLTFPSGRCESKRIWGQITPLHLTSGAARGRAWYLRAQD